MLENKELRSRSIVGAVIIILGVTALLQNVITGDAMTWAWIIALGVSAVIFGWGYTLVKEAWAVIGAYVTIMVAALIFLGTKTTVSGNWLPSFVLLAIGLPFAVAWWFSRKDWGLLIPAYVMAVLVPILWLGDSANENLVPAYVLFAIGLPFIVGFGVSHKWPLLLVGGILALIGLGLLTTGAGLSGQILTIAIPAVLIVVGAFMLLQAFGQPRKQE